MVDRIENQLKISTNLIKLQSKDDTDDNGKGGRGDAKFVNFGRFWEFIRRKRLRCKLKQLKKESIRVRTT